MYELVISSTVMSYCSKVYVTNCRERKQASTSSNLFLVIKNLIEPFWLVEHGRIWLDLIRCCEKILRLVAIGPLFNMADRNRKNRKTKKGSPLYLTWSTLMEIDRINRLVNQCLTCQSLVDSRWELSYSVFFTALRWLFKLGLNDLISIFYLFAGMWSLFSATSSA